MSKLLPRSGNVGGFRIAGTSPKGRRYVSLLTSGADPDWPDGRDPETGCFTYFGDNKKSGSDLHKTHRGNICLRGVFDCLRADPPGREKIPPTFLFEQTGDGRDGRETLPSSRTCHRAVPLPFPPVAEPLGGDRVSSPIFRQASGIGAMTNPHLRTLSPEPRQHPARSNKD